LRCQNGTPAVERPVGRRGIRRFHTEKPLEKSEHTIRPLPAVAFITRIYIFIQTPQNHPWPEKWRKPR